MKKKIAKLLTKIFSINFLQFLLLNILKKYEKKVFKRITVNNNKILYGPFKNLIIPKNIPFLNLHYLLGTYEYWLQKIIINCVKKKKKIIQIGCASGYYTNGLAFVNKNLKAFGFDISKKHIKYAIEIAKANNLINTKYFAVKKKHDYSNFDFENSFLIIDIEGGEYEICNIKLIQKLSTCTILLELHNTNLINLENGKKELIKKFSRSHNYKIIDEEHKLFLFPKLIKYFDFLGSFGQFILQIERKTYNQKWLLLIPHKK